MNFVRALKASPSRYKLAGTDYSKYYIEFPDLDSRYLTPRHDSPVFVCRVAKIAKKEKSAFIHPQPSSEALVLSAHRRELPAGLFLPDPEVMRTGQDKLATERKLRGAGVRAAKTVPLKKESDIDAAFDRLAAPVWVRARHGAGGRLSLACGSPEEARAWVRLWRLKGTDLDEFIVQDLLPGRNIAWDSIWKEGRLVTSYCRERLEYPFKHISPSGITGTPSVARTVRDAEVNRVSERAVRAISRRPHGAFSVDVKEDSGGRPCVTEVDAGKFHTTMPLWGYVAYRHLHLPWFSNLADLYVRLGLGEEVPGDVDRLDAIPSGYYLIRNIDSGVILWREDGWKERVL